MKELEIIFYGRVQAVAFRHKLAQIAKNLNINGYIENNDDGSVYCIAQGSESALEEFLSWAQKFSFPIKLTGMKFEWREILSKKYKNFKVKFSNDNLFTDEASGLLNLSKRLFQRDNLNIPNHVVIIPDGNRRWARAQGWLPFVGHRRAITSDKLIRMFEASENLGIEFLTFWGFSTENWDRDPKEISVIFDLIVKMMPELEDYMHKKQIRFRHLGRKDRLPENLIQVLTDVEQRTKKYSKFNFQLCFDYGGRTSIIEAINKIIGEGLESVTEKDLIEHLESYGIPDPDLIIRTSGEQRTSGIMAFEGVYAELYFTNVMFPDFDTIEFERAILDYSARTRRFGGTSKNDFKNIKTNLLIDPDL